MKSWKTTLLGAAAAAWVAVEPIVTTGHIDWKKIGIAAVIAAFGYLVKDANVTGTK